MLQGYDPADPTVTISPGGLRFKWINDVPHWINGEYLMPMESYAADSYVYNEMMASFPPFVDVYGKEIWPDYWEQIGSIENGGGFIPRFNDYVLLNDLLGTEGTRPDIWTPAQAVAGWPQIYAPLALYYAPPSVTGTYTDPIASFGLTNVPSPVTVSTSQGGTMTTYTNAQLIDAVKASMAQGFSFEDTRKGAALNYGITAAQWNSINWAAVLGNQYPAPVANNPPVTSPVPGTTTINPQPPFSSEPETEPGFFEGVSPGMMIAAAVALFTLFK